MGRALDTRGRDETVRVGRHVVDAIEENRLSIDQGNRSLRQSRYVQVARRQSWMVVSDSG